MADILVIRLKLTEEGVHYSHGLTDPRQVTIYFTAFSPGTFGPKLVVTPPP